MHVCRDNFLIIWTSIEAIIYILNNVKKLNILRRDGEINIWDVLKICHYDLSLIVFGIQECSILSQRAKYDCIIGKKKMHYLISFFFFFCNVIFRD